jgi:hypothetical protein
MEYPNDFENILSDLKKGINNHELYVKYGYNEYVGIKARKGINNRIDSIIITWNRAKSTYDNYVNLEKSILTYIGAGLSGKQELGRQNSTLVNYFDNRSDIPVVFCSKIEKEIKFVSMLIFSENGYVAPSPETSTFKFYFYMYDIDVNSLTKLLNILPNEKIPWKKTSNEVRKKKKETLLRIIKDQKLRDLIKELQFIGDLGELLVIEYEISRLKSIGLDMYIDKIEHASITRGHGLGYDIISYDIFSGVIKPIYIEVKSTKLEDKNAFYMTENEYNVMKLMNSQYRIYRVYEIYETDNTISIYEPPYSELDFQIITNSSYKVIKK